MPVHDWTRVNDRTCHDFHHSWVLEIKRALKQVLLPKGYYVMAGQVSGDLGAPDVLTLQAAGKEPESEGPLAGTATLTESHPIVHARTTISRDCYSGETIPQMPLFLTRENYIRVPLEGAYTAAWEDVPPQYQVLLASS